jgi:hypothetical protein
VSFVIYTSAR